MGILVVQASNQMPCRLNYPVPFAFAETNIYSITIEPLSAHSLPKCRPPEMLSTTSSTSRSCAPSSSDDMAETRPPARREQGVAQCEGMLPLPRVDIALRRSPYHVTSTPTSTTRTGPFDGSGPDEKDREVLVKFDCVAREFNLLKHEYRAIIKDIAKGMGNFMADYAKMADENANGLSVKNIKDYELYRHYVAGLVDEGLTRLSCSNIRDIREDYDSKRYFWPEEVWSKYVENFSDLFLPQNREKALQRSINLQLCCYTANNGDCDARALLSKPSNLRPEHQNLKGLSVPNHDRINTGLSTCLRSVQAVCEGDPSKEQPQRTPISSISTLPAARLSVSLRVISQKKRREIRTRRRRGRGCDIPGGCNSWCYHSCDGWRQLVSELKRGNLSSP
ncbi:farnesyl-diphosphate farnesyltransferase [Coccidioides immitis RS]|uniref:Farnesyl-diphosphate farnesyltransferase n=1 Tax=Coccidioides immitis (strain RS) TaxID=246410 RepID=J3KEA8_COCIM|nr:farnesyl-diphosphate farnesyltransferase [Coccidioides immitis RS]EAS33797.3 farnesyl-diphosphate farnesyltransferase [Coccidioides immitis RS]TPX21434.1 Farnesyl-diphosphate farnesyltransferase [Coccidioides immitis]